MNAVVSQTLHCLIHNSNEMKPWDSLLSTVELVVNSLPNSSTGFSPFYLNYGYEPVTPIELLRGNELAKTEAVEAFVRRVSSDWRLTRENLERSVRLQAKYYCCALCPGVVDWHNCGIVLGVLESGLGIGWNKYLTSVTLYVGMGPL